MASLLQIAQLGHPVVRRPAKPVNRVNIKKIQKLADDMIATLLDADGVGIAAPQVYQSLKICIIASHPNPRYPEAPNMKPLVMINPEVIWHAKKKVKDWEGCLSIPGIRGKVPRFLEVTVNFMDIKGKRKKKTFSDFVARIVQHELDHLEGKVFLDRLESTLDIITEKEYHKRIMRHSLEKHYDLQ